MLKADEAKIQWSPEKKKWQVVIHIGAEVIKRWAGNLKESGDDALRSLAVATAKDEGYEVDAARVTVAR
jgi:hypothetical protein